MAIVAGASVGGALLLLVLVGGLLVWRRGGGSKDRLRPGLTKVQPANTVTMSPGLAGYQYMYDADANDSAAYYSVPGSVTYEEPAEQEYSQPITLNPAYQSTSDQQPTLPPQAYELSFPKYEVPLVQEDVGTMVSNPTCSADADKKYAAPFIQAPGAPVYSDLQDHLVYGQCHETGGCRIDSAV